MLIQIDEYFDLTDMQTEFLRPKVVSHLRWVQQKIIPQLITELERLKNQQEPIRNQQFLILQKKTWKMWNSIIDRIADDGAWLFINLSPQQLKHLQEQLRNKHQEYYEPAFSSKTEFPAKFKKFQETTLKGFETLVGEFSEQQRAKFSQVTQESQESLGKDSEIITQNRVQFFQKVSALRQQKELAIFFRQWVLNPNVGYQKFRLKRKQRTLQILSILEADLTVKQKEFRQAKLDDYITDLKVIREVIF
ncbi:MAG: DUF6279 family lipoprotein [Methylococcaceae bacterium]|nr:DUF6279 family lipoprotein [Methylococcaceae bacterium]